MFIVQVIDQSALVTPNPTQSSRAFNVHPKSKIPNTYLSKSKLGRCNGLEQALGEDKYLCAVIYISILLATVLGELAGVFYYRATFH